jgi:hypothetical protein
LTLCTAVWNAVTMKCMKNVYPLPDNCVIYFNRLNSVLQKSEFLEVPLWENQVVLLLQRVLTALLLIGSNPGTLRCGTVSSFCHLGSKSGGTNSDSKPTYVCVLSDREGPSLALHHFY